MKTTKLHNRTKNALTIAGLICIILIGLIVRLEDLRDWQQQPEISFVHNEPVLTTIDGYFYLRQARDLLEEGYSPIDTMRTWPESPKRAVFPPLISILAAGISKVFHISLNWVGVVLPACLGVLVAVPVFAIGRLYGGTSMALTSALMVLLSYGYLTRSALGWFDTDCLNVYFTMAGIYYCMRFALVRTKERYLYFFGFLLNYGLFLWWWDSTPQAVTVIVMLPLLVSLLFFYRPAKKEGLLFYGFLALLCGSVLFWKGLNLPVQMMENLFSTLHYISKQTDTFFPNVSQLVLEQRTAPIQEIIDGTLNSTTAFFTALLGLTILALNQSKRFLFLLAPCILSVMTLLFSQRFIIFSAPVLSLGFGYFISTLWQLKKLHPKIVFLVPLLVLAVAISNFQLDMSKTFWQINVASVAKGMDFMAHNIPEDAIVFARWDVGYPIQYWARRPTVADGSFHGGERSVYNAIPPTTTSERLAANFINFWVHNGMQGFAAVYQATGDKNRGFQLVKNVLRAGPEKSYDILKKAHLNNLPSLRTIQDWQRFFFPKTQRPIYWFFDYAMAESSYWWFWLGTWDIAQHKGQHPRFRSFVQVQTDGRRFSNGKDIHGLLSNGTITTSARTVQVQSADIVEGNNLAHTISYPVTPENRDNFFSFFIPGQFAALQGTAIHNSVFSRLFLQHRQSRYFVPVRLRTPAYQIYRVRADTFLQQ